MWPFHVYEHLEQFYNSSRNFHSALAEVLFFINIYNKYQLHYLCQTYLYE